MSLIKNWDCQLLDLTEKLISGYFENWDKALKSPVWYTDNVSREKMSFFFHQCLYHLHVIHHESNSIRCVLCFKALQRHELPSIDRKQQQSWYFRPRNESKCTELQLRTCTQDSWWCLVLSEPLPSLENSLTRNNLHITSFNRSSFKENLNQKGDLTLWACAGGVSSALSHTNKHTHCS